MVQVPTLVKQSSVFNDVLLSTANKSVSGLFKWFDIPCRFNYLRPNHLLLVYANYL